MKSDPMSLPTFSILEELYKKYRQKINYVLVGGWNTVLGFAIFVALYKLLNQRVHYIILVVMSDVICITNAYIGYKYFVFKTKGNFLRELFRFYVVYGISFIINIVLMLIMVELLKVRPIPAKFIIIFILTLLSYLGHKHYSFGKPAEIGTRN